MNAAESLDRTSTIAGVASIAIGAIRFLGYAIGRSAVPALPGAAAPPFPWPAVSITLLGLGLVAISRRGDSLPVRRAVIAASLLALIAPFGGVFTHQSPSIVSVLGELRATRPLGSIALILASASLVVRVIARERFIAGLLGVFVITIGFVDSLGYIYGGPLLTGLGWSPVPLASALVTLLIGVGLITAGGTAAWPNRLFVGNSVQTVMLRWLIPLMAVAIVATDVADADLFAHFSRAVGSALNTVVSVAVTVAVISYLGRVIGGRVERAEQNFTHVFKSVPAGLAISEVETGRFIEVNDQFARIYGYSPEEMIGRRSTDLGMWADAEERAAYVGQVVASGADLNGVVRNMLARGRRPIVVRTAAQSVVFRDKPAILVSVIDVTEQRRAEEALRISERKFGSMFRESPVALMVTEVGTGRFIDVNAAYLALVGVSDASEIIGKTSIEMGFLTHEDRDRCIVKPLENGQTHGLIVPCRNIRGEALTWELAVSEFKHDGQRFVLVSAVDVTDRLRIEREARTELAERRRVQRRLNLALRAGGIAIWEFDIASRRFKIDPERFEFYGLAPSSDFTISWETWASRVHPDDRLRLVERIESVANGAAAEVEVDFRDVRLDGSVRFVRSAAVLQPADSDMSARIVGMTIDVTEQHLTEQELRKHKEGLEALVTTRTAELRAAVETAERASRAKGTFLAHMSHEIRTPMNAILGYAQLLMIDESLDAQQRRKVTAIHTSGDHLLGLLNDILEMSRIEAGRLTLSLEPFDLRELLDGVQSMFTELTARRGLRFEMQIAPTLIRGVQTDAGKVRQVLINLLGNATKFTDKGGIVVRVSSRDVDPDQAEVSIAVEDTGPGIPTEAQELIFSAFGQAETGKQRSGTGLGLTISRSVARLMGGDLSVTSTVGSGSTFTFTFVAVAIPDTALAQPARRLGAQRLDPLETRRRALVVDDVASNRELLAESLSRAGFETRSASSGEEAIEVHREWSPDLVMMDLHMPGMGGVSAIQFLRDARTKAAIVVTTAGADDSTAATVTEAGAVGLLRKPYRESELFATIGRAMNVKFVEAPPPLDAPSLAAAAAHGLHSLVREIPPDLVAELRDACRQARAARLVQLADRVGQHSDAAAAAIRDVAHGFRYRDLLGALEDAFGPGDSVGES